MLVEGATRAQVKEAGMGGIAGGRSRETERREGAERQKDMKRKERVSMDSSNDEKEKELTSIHQQRHTPSHAQILINKDGVVGDTQNAT